MTIQEIADLVSGEVTGSGDRDITGVADIRSARKGQLAFIENGSSDVQTRASCVLIGSDFSHRVNSPSIRVKNPKLAFAKVAELLHPQKQARPSLHQTSVIANSAQIGSDVYIGALCTVGERSKIGDGTQLHAGVRIGERVNVGCGCILHSNVVIEDGCTIGNNVILHSGVVIGADGFGYVRDKERHIKFPQIGTVVIEDGVEIGASTCIDRGALGETRIGWGTKIDNLVQVGHNVTVGKRVVIAAQTGISGSTIIEDDCIIGGQVGIGDHTRIQSGAVIGSQAGVLPGKIVRPGVWWGTPIQPLEEYKRQNAYMKGISRMKEEIKMLKEKIEELSSRLR